MNITVFSIFYQNETLYLVIFLTLGFIKKKPVSKCQALAAKVNEDKWNRFGKSAKCKCARADIKTPGKVAQSVHICMSAARLLHLEPLSAAAANFLMHCTQS
jgi:hypothetical protein